MSRPPLHIASRLALAVAVFAMALLLTPRALLDVTSPADSHEIPINMLDSSDTDDCLWCSKIPDPPQADDATDDCDDDRLYSPSYPNDDCRDSFRTREPSA